METLKKIVLEECENQFYPKSAGNRTVLKHVLGYLTSKSLKAQFCSLNTESADLLLKSVQSTVMFEECERCKLC